MRCSKSFSNPSTQVPLENSAQFGILIESMFEAHRPDAVVFRQLISERLVDLLDLVIGQLALKCHTLLVVYDSAPERGGCEVAA